jgi:hypothetical protein
LKLVTRVEFAGEGVGAVGGEGVVVAVLGAVGAGDGAAAAATGVPLVEELISSEPLEPQPLIIEKETLHTNPTIAVRALTLFAIATCSHRCANHADSKRLRPRLELTQPAFG